jgi:hypothetical protein
MVPDSSPSLQTYITSGYAICISFPSFVLHVLTLANAGLSQLINVAKSNASTIDLTQKKKISSPFRR